MWSPRATIIALLALALAGCGFEPLHGAQSDGASGRLAVDVVPIADREGQLLRAALRRAFAANAAPEYRLAVVTRERIVATAIDPRGDVTRRQMTVTADWRLQRLAAAADEKPISGSARVLEGFSVLASDYANVTAERAARARAAGRLAHLIAQAATVRARAAAAR